MLARYDLADYLLDNYGTCARDADCYWGKDDRGDWNGCLRIGWRGRQCPHWRPLGATTLDELADAHGQTCVMWRWWRSLARLLRALKRKNRPSRSRGG